ncbi:hypothetical protein MMC07_006560 [Pseudocyphellaria aurata]|nr:hypothetical protein [Pseudocyphellaria aurata]
MSSPWTSKRVGRDAAAHHKVISVPDLPSTDLLQHLPDAVAFIEQGMGTGGSVLVHCIAGVSRSTTPLLQRYQPVFKCNSSRVQKLLLAARVQAQRQPAWPQELILDEALASIKKSRSIICPNLAKSQPQYALLATPVECPPPAGSHASTIRLHNSCAVPHAGFMHQLQQWHANGCTGPSLLTPNTQSPPTRPRLSSGSAGMRAVYDQLTQNDPALIRQGGPCEQGLAACL